MSGKEVKEMYNDPYSIEELLAELSQLVGQEIGTSNEDNTVTLSRKEVQTLISLLNR